VGIAFLVAVSWEREISSRIACAEELEVAFETEAVLEQNTKVGWCEQVLRRERMLCSPAMWEWTKE
jgi:hypothetical protein